MDANKYHITFPKGNALSFPDFKDVKKKNILIFGNVDHIFGCFDGDIQGQELTRYMENILNFKHMVLNDNTILFMVFEEDKKYIWSMIDKYVEFLKTWYCFDPKLAERFEKKAKKDTLCVYREICRR